ncbi:hypothetical protein [Saccharicrinis aurantiacus]|uniref:hypothetical protein n=1 Tax=Saccharicrinis aurantiacus TaxID=1849719 RepID=UPI002490ADE7|nr:hypothetical protein [Saccharicrinis aurantiacus]
MNNKGTFSTLELDAEIYNKIKEKQPEWWKLMLEDKELYIEIRKDNYINVYYLGGSLAKIKYKDGFILEIHYKYLKVAKPQKDDYISISPKIFDKEKIAEIKGNIESTLRSADHEHPSEKRIQGEMIIQNSEYIDSEFQFNKDKEIGKLRIDLIELKDGYLSFVELKGISDSRLRNDEERNPKNPEIIQQMCMYKSFITKYKDELEVYYKKLIAVKKDLGLVTISQTDWKINETPKLLIADTYKKVTLGRTKRIEAIKSLLADNEIDFEFIKWK